MNVIKMTTKNSFLSMYFYGVPFGSKRNSTSPNCAISSNYLLYHGVQRRMNSVDIFFRIFEIIIFCFVVALCHLVHDVETIFHLSYVLTANGNVC